MLSQKKAITLQRNGKDHAKKVHLEFKATPWNYKAYGLIQQAQLPTWVCTPDTMCGTRFDRGLIQMK